MSKSESETHHYRVRILDPQGGGDYIRDYGADLTAARAEYNRACQIPRKRTTILEGVNLKTGRAQTISTRR